MNKRTLILIVAICAMSIACALLFLIDPERNPNALVYCLLYIVIGNQEIGKDQFKNKKEG